MADGVLEFPHVAGPILFLQEGDGLGINRRCVQAEFGRVALDEKLHQFRDVFRARAEGREMNGDDA